MPRPTKKEAQMGRETAKTRYERHMRKFVISFDRRKDQSVIDEIERHDNYTGYIRELVKRDVERGGR